MSILFVFLIIGMMLGFYDMIAEKYLTKLKKVPLISLIFILFLMGAKIGMEPKIVQNISRIGFKAAMISIASILGSLACIKLFLGKTDFAIKGQEEKQ